MAAPEHQAKYFTAQHIRRHGAIGSLNEGVVIKTQGVHTRLIAWPGNGYQTESVHVLTVKPGEERKSYAYTLAEEAMLCVAGRGEVFLHGRWISVEPGDMPYFTGGSICRPGGKEIHPGRRFTARQTPDIWRPSVVQTVIEESYEHWQNGLL